MGKTLTYEVGKANIGRKVRCNAKDGARAASFGTLVGCTSSHAEIKLDNYSGPSMKFDWKDVRDWTSRNAAPLRPAVPEAKPLIATKIAAAPVAPAPVQAVESTAPDPFAVFGSVSAKLPAAVAAIDAAEEDIDAATEMLEQAKAKHSEAVAKLAELRKQIATATAVIDSHLIGTSEART